MPDYLVNDPEILLKNKLLYKELAKRGYSIVIIGHLDEIHYMVVSAVMPKPILAKEEVEDIASLGNHL